MLMVVSHYFNNNNKSSMTLHEAIKARHSVRVYKDQPLADEVVRALEEKIAELNRVGQLHIQLILNEPKAFQGKLAKYGRFRNVQNYIIIAGRETTDLDERSGYYGEQLVLLAQTLGLNTCWVGITYTKIPGTYALDVGEKVSCCISLGYGVSQGMAHRIKKLEQVSRSLGGPAPLWFRSGVEAALLAPTAVNQQKFLFEYLGIKDGRHQVRAMRLFSLFGYTKMDLGIAKYHFEVGAGKENFEWVN